MSDGEGVGHDDMRSVVELGTTKAELSKMVANGETITRVDLESDGEEWRLEGEMRVVDPHDGEDGEGA